MTTAPYIALVADDETFEATTHARRDLIALDLEISGADMELPWVSMRVKNPRTPLSALPNQRIFISVSGRLIFDGRLSSVPRGTVDRTIQLEAIARPDDLDQQLAVLAEDLKQAPYWDALFVPAGSEDDWTEILAARAQVLAYSRTGVVSAVSALAGSTTLSIAPLPIAGSVRYDREPVAPSFGIEIQAKWKQSDRQIINLHDGNAFRDFSTTNWKDILERFPRAGVSIGSGFTVRSASAARVVEAFSEPEEVLTRFGTAPGLELDPAFLDGYEKQDLTIVPMRLDMSIEHAFEVSRTETASFTFPVSLQDGASEGEAEIEQVALRDIAERSTAPAWQPDTDYFEGDEVVDGESVYAAREDHTSGTSRDASRWSLIGEASYVSSRRVSSFLRSARGRAALDHAVERVRARAMVAARCVTVEFDSAMPDPWLVTEDCSATIAHDLIPGGSVTGRLVAYSLNWSAGRRWMTGTIAACPGTGEGADIALDVVDGSPVNVRGRVDVSIRNTGAEQGADFLAGNTPSPTRISIRTTPAPTGDFEHAVDVSISGSVSVPQGVII
jgi:hypothetical protein